MKWSLYLGKPAGIKVFVHWTFLLLVIWLSWMHLQQGHGLFEIVMGLVFLVALFTCVTLHEFGHALAARRFGVGTRDINLLPIGGVARLERMPEDPKEELIVAAAGPAVNVAIAAVLFILLLATGQSEINIGAHITGDNFWGDLLLVNVILVLFNLIPAFPMDGGRMLRATLAFKMKRSKATQIAASIGQMLAISFVFIGLFYNPFLVFIGIFIFLGAGAEARHVSMAESFKQLRVKDILKNNYPSVSLSASVGKAASVMIENPASDIVVTDGNRFEGLISNSSILQALKSDNTSLPVVDIIEEDITTLRSDIFLSDLVNKLNGGRQSIYPVVDNGKLLGVVTETDLNNILLNQQSLISTGQ